MQKTYKTAIWIRILTVPPLMAAWLMLTLWLARDDIILRPGEGVMSLLCLALTPLLAYPLSWFFPGLRKKGRECQRDMAFVFSALGYLAGWLWVCLTPCTAALRFLFGTYLFSVLILLLCNKLLHMRSSGHACSVAGPALVILCLLGGWWIPVCVTVYGLSFWASVHSGRHTVREYLLGTLSVLLAAGLAALIYLR